MKNEAIGAQPEFESAFWGMYESELRHDIERSCVSHARRLGHAVDPDDMVSWIGCRVWKLMQTAPNPIIEEGVDAAGAVERIRSAMPMLTRWAYLAFVRKASKTRTREHGADMGVVESLSAARAVPDAFETAETVRTGLDALRSRVGADVRGKLAATWPEAGERERIADALDANRDEDAEVRRSVIEGELKENTVHQMRSRSLKRSRAVFEDARESVWKFLPMVAIAAVVALLTAAPAWAGNDDDDDGEQTGGRSAHVLPIQAG